MGSKKGKEKQKWQRKNKLGFIQKSFFAFFVSNAFMRPARCND
jgi:hypothetical protein